MKITRKIFWDLAIFMMFFGLIVGALFIPFSLLLGIAKEEVLNALFILSCLSAGLVVGLFNYYLAKKLVGKKLKTLSQSMQKAIKHIEDKDYDNDDVNCLNECLIEVDSDDEIGESSDSFNKLIKSFLTSQQNEKSIREFTKIFTTELDYKKLSNKALVHLIRYSNASAGMVVIDQGGYLEVASSYLIKDTKSIIDGEIIKESFESKIPIEIELNDTIKIDGGVVSFIPKVILTIPLIYNDNIIGVILIASATNISSELKNNLITYSHGLALGMNNALIHQKIQKLAVYDSLTKVYNRRFGMQRLNEELARALRSEYPFGLMMIDIDKFKSVNDTYGHLVGDLVLINLCRLIQESIREGDILVRFGGEEFLVIVPGASLRTTVDLAEKIRRTVEENVVHNLDQELRITISAGVSAYPDNKALNIENLIKFADDNLYKAKESGRNRVEFTEPK